MQKQFKEITFLEQPARSQPKCLLILLHGYGSNEQDLFSFAPEMPSNFTILCPRGLHKSPFGGFSWYDINFEDAKKFNNREQAHDSIQQLSDFLDWALAEYKPLNNEIWLGGFSQGCILSYGLSQLHSAVRYGLCLSGYWPSDMLGEMPTDKRHPNLDLFISHGTADAVIPFEWAKNSLTEFEKRGIKHEFKEYPAGHGVNRDNFLDLMEWIKLRNPVKSH